MLAQEAQFWGQTLAEMPFETISPMLNVGSSTEHFRTVQQPAIDQFIFAPLRHRAVEIVHLDMKDAPGVDLVGDLSDAEFRAGLRRRNFRSVFCSNLLEHVEHREAIAATILDVLPAGGYLFVSCPYSYPYHPDPIDTLFRPSSAELHAVFPDTHLVRAQTVEGETYLQRLQKERGGVGKNMVRMLLPFYQPQVWLWKVRYMPWLLRKFSVTAVVLQKSPGAQFAAL